MCETRPSRSTTDCRSRDDGVRLHGHPAIRQDDLQRKALGFHVGAKRERDPEQRGIRRTVPELAQLLTGDFLGIVASSVAFSGPWITRLV